MGFSTTSIYYYVPLGLLHDPVVPHIHAPSTVVRSINVDIFLAQTNLVGASFCTLLNYYIVFTVVRSRSLSLRTVAPEERGLSVPRATYVEIAVWRRSFKF